MKKISELRNRIDGSRSKVLVLAGAEDKPALSAVMKSYHEGIITPVFVGEKDKIKSRCKEMGYPLDGLSVHHTESVEECIETSVKLVRSGEANIIMKGSVKTPDLLKGVLNKEWGLNPGGMLSHFALFESEHYPKLFAITDVAINIAPDVDAKKRIVENTVGFMRRLGVETPKVAALAAIEMVNPKMQATLDADALTKLNESGEIKDCKVFGPLAFDCAMSPSRAKHKGIENEVAGHADILLVPNIETGNALYKSLLMFSQPQVASVVVGAGAPIVLTSRTDSDQTKFNSILLGASV